MPREFGPAITSIGKGLPEHAFSNQQIIDDFGVDSSDEWIRTNVGIKQRYIAGPEQATSDFAVAAATNALERARLKASDIDHVIVATATPDYLFPSTAVLVQDRLGANAGAHDVMAACTGGIYALADMCSMHEADLIEINKSLVIGAETLTRHVNWEDRGTAVLFGDGAGAVVIENIPNPGLMKFVLGADGSQAKSLYIPSGGSRNPITEQVLEEGNDAIIMNGPKTFKHAVNRMSEAAEEVMQKAHLTDALGNIDTRHIDHVIPHQANVRIMNAVWNRFGLPVEKRVSKIEKYGNTSAASIFIAMNDAYEDGTIKKDDVLLLVAFGAGFTYGAAVLQWQLENK